VTRTTMCANYLRQHALFLTQYVADCRERIPSPTSIHRSGNSGAWGTSTLAVVTTNGSTGAACPEGEYPRCLPAGFGWYFYMGYVPVPPAKAKLGMWDCPDAKVYAPWASSGVTLPQGREFFYSGFTKIASALAARTLNTGVNPEGGNWDCVNYGATGYFYRGYFKTSAAQSKRLGEWGPGNAVEVCSETANGFMDVHGPGFNIAFYDGHVGFGGKKINGTEPYVYYSMTYNGYSQSQADGSAGTGSHNGWAYAGGSGTTRMWRYYETGIP